MSEPSKGRFFAVDWRAVEDATRYGDGVNTALAYITLARFTGRSQRSTTAGATAIRKALGLTMGRTDLALKTIERAGLISPVTKGTARTITPLASSGGPREPNPSSESRLGTDHEQRFGSDHHGNGS